MKDITENIEVLCHSSIRITGERMVIYVDPYQIDGQPQDADVILITHEHYDHFSPEDIDKVKKASTRLIVPQSMEKRVQGLVPVEGKLHTIVPDGICESRKMVFKAIPAYNKLKPFHPKKNAWVGYLFEVDGVRIYVAGDTDFTEEAGRVKCDIALVPIGGKFTMDAKKAAELVNTIRPQVAIPTHYGTCVGDEKDAALFAACVEDSIQVKCKLFLHSDAEETK